MIPAIRAVPRDGRRRPGPSPSPAAEDRRVQEDDVGHDHERGQARADLRAEVGAALGELEVVSRSPSTGSPYLLPSDGRAEPLGRARTAPWPSRPTLRRSRAPRRRSRDRPPDPATRPRGRRGRAAPSGRSRCVSNSSWCGATARRRRRPGRSARTRRRPVRRPGRGRRRAAGRGAVSNSRCSKESMFRQIASGVK